MAQNRQSSSDTPQRLVHVASRLFAESSVDAVSIRSITRAANLGPASVHYHFKTKDALLDAVIDRYSGTVLRQMLDRGQLLLDSPTPPDVHQVIDCVASPYFELIAQKPQEGSEWLRIVGQLARAQDARVTKGATETTALIHALVARCFPTTPPEHREVATAVAISALVTLVGQTKALTGRNGAVPPETQRLVIDFVAGGLEQAALTYQ